jgi:hypothetical protein
VQFGWLEKLEKQFSRGDARGAWKRGLTWEPSMRVDWLKHRSIPTPHAGALPFGATVPDWAALRRPASRETDSRQKYFVPVQSVAGLGT